MLKHLSIVNYALIDDLSLDLDGGLSILTGETGAGKSIILGALSLIMGNRADTSVLSDKSKKCIVEGSFSVSHYKLEKVFDALDLDYEDVTVIRREINAKGKSRAFVNDTPVNLADLKQLVIHLIDIHSQHQTLELNQTLFQLNALDGYAGINDKVDRYGKEYLSYKQKERELNLLLEKESKVKSELEYINHQYNELDEANLSNGEQDELEAELKALNHIEEVKTYLQNAIQALSEGDQNIIAALGNVGGNVEKAASFVPELDDHSKRLQATIIELNDLNAEIDRHQQDLIHKPEKILEINDRLDLIYSLQHKHQVGTIAELIQLKESLNLQLSDVVDMGLQIKTLQEEQKSQLLVLTNKAEEISNDRNNAAIYFQKEIIKLLIQLGMKDATFAINLTHSEIQENGKDNISFLFSANKGIEPNHISKIASGGELSRLMLSIKSIVAKKQALPTIIFDEIDTGISGEVADKTGIIVKNIARDTQIICITHLPQMASKGDNHYLVYKSTDNSRTQTHIKKLNEGERINEVAKMLSGEVLSEQAIENAKVLLKA